MSALPAADLVVPARPRRPERSRFRVVTMHRPVPQPDASRAPFIGLILVLIGAGMTALLGLNTAIAADSFTQQSLQQDLAALQLHEQELAQQVNEAQAPAALAAAARAQGMIPSGQAAFVVRRPDGTVQITGTAVPATRPPPPTPPPGASPAPGAGPAANQPAGTPDAANPPAGTPDTANPPAGRPGAAKPPARPKGNR